MSDSLLDFIPAWWHADCIMGDRYFREARKAEANGDLALAHEYRQRGDHCYERAEQAYLESQEAQPDERLFVPRPDAVENIQHVLAGERLRLKEVNA